MTTLLALFLALETTSGVVFPRIQQKTTPDVLSSAKAEIERIIALSGAEVSVIYRPVGGALHGEILINPDTTYHAASTMKVPVMIELFRQVDAKLIKLDDQIPVSNIFHSIVDGSEYTLASNEAADGPAFLAIGKTMSYRDLCEQMITISSNLATNVLMEKLGVENIRATVAKLKAPGMNVLRGVEDQKAFDKGMSNQTTARALMTLLTAIANGAAGSKSSCAEMQAILKRQKFNDGIPAGVPAEIAVAHKTGTITAIHHDAAIVYAKEPYILVVMTRGMPDEKKSDLLIAEISRIIYRMVTTSASLTGLGPVASDGLFLISPFTTIDVDPPPSRLSASVR
ncbi:MAG: serine hydrolase [Acidobacteria bacterium]|nr:MAG: serine hydrolase [Acidobacteriota bacterium]